MVPYIHTHKHTYTHILYIKEVSAHPMGSKGCICMYGSLSSECTLGLLPLSVCYITPHITSHIHLKLCVETLTARRRSLYSACIKGFDEKIHTSVADGPK